MNQKPHVLYAVRFSDGRTKIGISADVERRMTYYAQEARRNRVSHLTWWACKPFKDKSAALLAERVLCRVWKDNAIAGHREWIDGAEYASVINDAEQLRASIGDEVGEDAADLPWSGAHGFISTGAQA